MDQMREAFFAGQPTGPYFTPMMPPPMPAPTPAPAGLHALYTACRSVYPNQQNPLQVAAVVKYWAGGPDPLDFISMFAHPGDDERRIPPHWHYVSFGLSDLHGDGRVHQISGPDTPSGFGFELSFRLKREVDEQSPPTWPAAVMQSLAKYVFQSENTLCPGDHVSWHCSLDNSDSRIQHMVMTEDPQLGTVQTPFGNVTFIQIVGVCVEELQAAQQWNGPGLIDLMKSVDGVGGSWLVTDMRRGETIFELDPDIKLAVDDGINAEGSNLSGVTAKCSWSEKCARTNASNAAREQRNDEASTNNGSSDTQDDNSESESSSKYESASVGDSGAEKAILPTHGQEDEDNATRGALSPTMACSRASRHSSMSIEKAGASSVTAAQSKQADNEHNDQSSTSRMSYVADAQPLELIETKFLNAVHITLNSEAGVLLPLALRGRLKHGRHFTFKTVSGNLAITLLTESVVGAYATKERPYALHGPWLQVLIESQMLERVMSALSELQAPDELALPKTYTFADINLSFTIEPDEL